MSPITRSFVVVATLLVSGCSIHRMTRQGTYKEVVPEVFLSYLNDSIVNVIDVRTNSEFEKSHIKGAMNVNYFGGHFIKDLKALTIDNNRITLIYCETQHRSLMVAKKMRREGFKQLVDLDKGMMNWRKKGFPYIEVTRPAN